jgi:hypothetical protein
VQKEIKRLRAIPQIATAERACQDWFTARREAILTPDQIRHWSKPHARTAQT